MSLVRLGSASTRRRVEWDVPAGRAPGHRSLREGGAPRPGTLAVTAETSSETEKALEQLIQYVPTETVTLFLGAVTLLQTFEHIDWLAALRPWGIVAAFAALTPLILLGIAVATFRDEKRHGRIPRDAGFELPVFDMAASAVAFVPWALAVPGLFPDPAAGTSKGEGVWTADTAQVVAVVLAFATSSFLSYLRRIVAPLPPEPNGDGE